MFGFFSKKKNERKFCDIVTHLPLISPPYEDYNKVKNINELKKYAYILRMPELIDSKPFCDQFKNIQVNYANSSNATQLVGNDNFGNFVNVVMKNDNEKYVFHNVIKDAEAVEIMPKAIPVPKFLKKKSIHELRISRLYAGAKHSGTNLHIHSDALNYLVSGEKLWIMFPSTDMNNQFVEKHQMKYGQVTDSALIWFINNYQKLTQQEALEHFFLFKQKSKEVVYVPAGWHHAVINLHDSIGITYSWV